MDIATGYFEIGSLLSLHGQWQKVDGIRLLMGDEVSRRTKKAFDEGLARVEKRLDQSIEHEKKKNDFLDGVEVIVEAIRSRKIQCRVYRKDKFHAKAYITHARMEVVGSSALVGSSNFTYPGMTQNVELNVQTTGMPVACFRSGMSSTGKPQKTLRWRSSKSSSATSATIRPSKCMQKRYPNSSGAMN